MALSHRRRVILSRACLSLAVGFAVPLLGCGGGEGTTFQPVLAEVTLLNGSLTFGGQNNTAPITGYRFVNTGTLQVFNVSGLDLQAGDSMPVSVPPGSYNCLATYMDGSHETAQSPGDPMVVPSQSSVTLTFIR